MNQRDISLDLVRSIAILLVVLNHSVESFYPVFTSNISQFSVLSELFCFFSFSLGRIGVPLFLLLTGYLLLHKPYENDNNINLFYKNNLFSLVITWEIWIILYNIINDILNIKKFCFYRLIAESLFFKIPEMSNSWYMSMIIGIYLFIPFVAIVVNRVSNKNIIVLCLLAYFYFLFIPSINIFLKFMNQHNIHTILDLNFSGGCYGVYIIIGHFLYLKYINSTKNTFILYKFLLFLSLILAITFIQFKLTNSNYHYAVWYDFFLMPIIGLLCFDILKNININHNYIKIIRYISIYSFGIFLIHRPIQLILVKLFHHFNLMRPINTLILFISSFYISIILIRTLSNINFLGKLLFRIRFTNQIN